MGVVSPACNLYCEAAVAVMGAGVSVTPQGLKFLIRLCTDLGLAKEAQDYAVKLKKVEKVFVICVCCLVLLCPCLLKLLPCGVLSYIRTCCFARSSLVQREASGGNSRSGGPRRGTNRLGSGSTRVTSAGSGEEWHDTGCRWSAVRPLLSWTDMYMLLF